jgi:hypothetical protein
MHGMTADVVNLPPAASNIAYNNAAASPPFLHVVTAVSDCGSHDSDGGEHAMHARPGGGRGAGAGNGSPNTVPTFRGAPAAAASTGSGPATSSKPKRKRSMIACKNCNERRVRCDGATNGCVA